MDAGKFGLYVSGVFQFFECGRQIAPVEGHGTRNQREPGVLHAMIGEPIMFCLGLAESPRAISKLREQLPRRYPIRVVGGELFS
jgi:hypothetical protein